MNSGRNQLPAGIIINTERLFEALKHVPEINKVLTYICERTIIEVFLSATPEEDPVHLLYEMISAVYYDESGLENYHYKPLPDPDYNELMNVLVCISVDLEQVLQFMYPERNKLFNSYDYQVGEFRFRDWLDAYNCSMTRIPKWQMTP